MFKPIAIAIDPEFLITSLARFRHEIRQ